MVLSPTELTHTHINILLAEKVLPAKELSLPVCVCADQEVSTVKVDESLSTRWKALNMLRT